MAIAGKRRRFPEKPIHRRMPKRGFKNIFAKHYVAINLDRVQRAIDAGKLDAGQPIDAAALTAAGVIKSPRDGVRLLARGALKTKINISVAGASKAAAAAVEEAGGSVTVVAPRASGPDGKGSAEGDAGTQSGGE